jgi:hypothetical protein
VKSIRKSILGLLFVSCFSLTCDAHGNMLESARQMAREVIKRFLFSQAKQAAKEAFYKTMIKTYVVSRFDMKRFDQLDESQQIVLMKRYIEQFKLLGFVKKLAITDGFIAWDLGLLNCTVKNIHKECGKNTEEMARRLAAKVRRVNFLKHHWGKLLVGVGVGSAVLTAGVLYELDQFIYH